MGLRQIRLGETARVKVGPYAGVESEVLAVWNGMVKLKIRVDDQEKEMFFRLDEVARIVTSKTDAEIDAPLAREMLKDAGDALALMASQIDEERAAQLQREADKAGLPEIVGKALGLIPVANKLGLSGEHANVVSQIVEGLMTAAFLHGVGKDVYERLKK